MAKTLHVSFLPWRERRLDEHNEILILSDVVRSRARVSDYLGHHTFFHPFRLDFLVLRVRYYNTTLLSYQPLTASTRRPNLLHPQPIWAFASASDHGVLSLMNTAYLISLAVLSLFGFNLAMGSGPGQTQPCPKTETKQDFVKEVLSGRYGERSLPNLQNLDLSNSADQEVNDMKIIYKSRLNELHVRHAQVIESCKSLIHLRNLLWNLHNKLIKTRGSKAEEVFGIALSGMQTGIDKLKGQANKLLQECGEVKRSLDAIAVEQYKRIVSVIGPGRNKKLSQ